MSSRYKLITDGWDFFSGFQDSRVFIQHLIHKGSLLNTYFCPGSFFKILIFLQSHATFIQQKSCQKQVIFYLFKPCGFLQIKIRLLQELEKIKPV